MNRIQRELMAQRTHNRSSQLTPRNPEYRKWIDQHTFFELQKDAGRRDVTTEVCFPRRGRGEAYVVVKEAGVLAGRQEAAYFLRKFPALRTGFPAQDGAPIRAGDVVLRLAGPVHLLMKVERVILNLLGRMSGVATTAKRFVERAQRGNPGVLVVPTRKTLWGLLDKRACALGGAGTHRLSLDDAVLIKHNHLRASGLNLSRLLSEVLGRLSGDSAQQPVFVEVEIGSIREALVASRILAEAKKRGFPLPCAVMFDNLAPAKIKKALSQMEKTGVYDFILTEASGRISEKNIRRFAETGVDILSCGAMTHSAPMLDFSFRANAGARGRRSGRLRGPR